MRPVIKLEIQKLSQLTLMNFFRRKLFNDISYSEKKVREKQDGYLNADSTHLKIYMTVNFQDQTEDETMNNEKQDEDKSVNTTNKVSYASVCTSDDDEDITEDASFNPYE